VIHTFDRAAVDRLAARETAALRRRGVRAGHTVAWLGLNHPRQLALLLACHRLGARLLPLNWRLAGLELSLIVQHAGVQHLLHDAHFAELAAAVAELAALPRPPAAGHEPGDVLLVYTSGTTGSPKGAVHTAAGMMANIAAAIDAQGLDASTRTLAVLPMFHVGGLAIQVLPTLAAGGTVRLHERFDPGAWLHDVAAWRPTTSLLVPAVMRAIVEHPDWPHADLSSLRYLNSGSQIVPPALIRAFHARGVPVCQVYGSTETGPVSIVLRPDEAMAHVGAVGRPALGVQLRLGGDGEILLKAPQLLRGYHDSAVPAFDAQGWFHTGDLAVMHDDGMVEVVGRSKELIISGGENIHPGEIEGLVETFPEVAECAVIGLPDARWGEVPVLAWVPRGGRTALDLATVHARLDGQIARFKWPRQLVALDRLPRTPLGKVVRGDLQRQVAAAAPATGGR